MARNSQYTIVLPWMRAVIPDDLPALLVYARIFALTQGPDAERPVTEAELGQWAKITKPDNIAQALDYLLGYRRGENGELVRTGRCLIAHTVDNKPCYTRGDRNKAYRWYPVDIPEMDWGTDWRKEIRIDGWMLYVPRVDTAAKLLTYAAIYKFSVYGNRHQCDCSQTTLAKMVGVSARQIRRILSDLCPDPGKWRAGDPPAVIAAEGIPHTMRAYTVIMERVEDAQMAAKAANEAKAKKTTPRIKKQSKPAPTTLTRYPGADIPDAAIDRMLDEDNKCELQKRRITKAARCAMAQIYREADATCKAIDADRKQRNEDWGKQGYEGTMPASKLRLETYQTYGGYRINDGTSDG